MGRLRTFTAVDLDRATRSRCVALQQTLGRAATGVKWVEPANLHLTLLFLGEVDERAVPDVCRVVSAVCAGVDAFRMGVDGAGCFGDPRRPRTLWAGVGEGAAELVALHAALEAALLELGCYRREERRYTPHVTLGRVKTDRTNDRLAQALAEQSNWHAGNVAVGEVLVLSSQLLPEGPVYSVLSRAKLRGAA